MITTYSLIYQKVKKAGRNFEETICMGDLTVERAVDLHARLRAREQKITLTGMLVCASFIALVLPITLVIAHEQLQNAGMSPGERARSFLPGLHVAGYVMFWSTCCVNPLIYALSNTYYREAMVDTLRSLKEACLCRLNFPRKSTADPDRPSSRNEDHVEGLGNAVFFYPVVEEGFSLPHLS